MIPTLVLLIAWMTKTTSSVNHWPKTVCVSYDAKALSKSNQEQTKQVCINDPDGTGPLVPQFFDQQSSVPIDLDETKAAEVRNYAEWCVAELVRDKQMLTRNTSNRYFECGYCYAWPLSQTSHKPLRPGQKDELVSALCCTLHRKPSDDAYTIPPKYDHCPQLVYWTVSATNASRLLHEMNRCYKNDGVGNPSTPTNGSSTDTAAACSYPDTHCYVATVSAPEQGCPECVRKVQDCVDYNDVYDKLGGETQLRHFAYWLDRAERTGNTVCWRWDASTAVEPGDLRTLRGLEKATELCICLTTNKSHPCNTADTKLASVILAQDEAPATLPLLAILPRTTTRALETSSESVEPDKHKTGDAEMFGTNLGTLGAAGLVTVAIVLGLMGLGWWAKISYKKHKEQEAEKATTRLARKTSGRRPADKVATYSHHRRLSEQPLGRRSTTTVVAHHVQEMPPVSESE